MFTATLRTFDEAQNSADSFAAQVPNPSSGVHSTRNLKETPLAPFVTVLYAV